jgi:hypothetical protein
LKKLTAMGYGRNDALAALEKFDYDINKVSDVNDPIPMHRLTWNRLPITWLQMGSKYNAHAMKPCDSPVNGADMARNFMQLAVF